MKPEIKRRKSKILYSGFVIAVVSAFTTLTMTFLLRTPFLTESKHVTAGTAPAGELHPILPSVQSVSSVAQLCPTLCNPMNRSTSGLPVHHKLPE